MRVLALTLQWNVLLWKLPWLLPTFLLQKPHMRSKSHENVKCLECRLHLWCEGDIDALLVEGYTIQQDPPTPFSSYFSGWQLRYNYLLAWSSRKILKLLCGSSQNNIGAHPCLFPLQLGNLLSLMKLLRNILILPQLLQYTELSSCHLWLFGWWSYSLYCCSHWGVCWGFRYWWFAWDGGVHALPFGLFPWISVVPWPQLWDIFPHLLLIQMLCSLSLTVGW